ncbi:MAG: histidinol phosphate phosphatase [Bacteroidetes bacterium GWA2_31_9b]|nr:MAG: histidinol phosphate phosphatase [Bacteroidetes bacterium GWA2_31_9b]
MNKAIFFDRDGVINFDPGDYTYQLDEFKINDGIIENLKRLVETGYLLIIITNQGGIAKQIYSHDNVEKIHEYLANELKKSGIELTEIYYCPHHSDVEKCLCRKPGSLFIEKAIARFNIDQKKSYMIGDKMRDVEAAENAGIKGIKVDLNENIGKYVDRIIVG